MGLYPTPDRQATADQTERRGVGRRTVIEAAKAEVMTVDLADRLCGPGRLRRVGERWVGRCPLPGHEDKSPSFTVYPKTNSWWCFGCLRGGDVIELARFAWGYGKHEAAMAAANLLNEYGHEIPARPASWHRKQDRQKPVREAIAAARMEHVRRRLFRRFAAPVLLKIHDPEEREAEASALWDATKPLAKMMLDRAAGGGR